MASASVLDLIGNTPLLKLERVNPQPGVELWAKLESANPGGSVKDRPALNMILAAEADGRLTPDKTILEATSGNTGIGLAMVAAAKGYKLLLTMPESASLERRRIIQAYGAEILLTPAHLATDGAIEEAYRLAREEPDRFFLTDQFNNPDNPAAHTKTTGPEIYRQTDGRITHFVASLGTAGTVMGCREYFKKSADPKIQVVAVEPFFGHKIQGLKNMTESYRPGIFDKNLVDRIINVDDEEAFEAARRLAREEGLLVGMSSGAALAGALKLCAELESGVVVTILPDTGERYLSTPLFAPKTEPTLRLYNTAARAKEPFVAQDPGQVRIHTGGPTADGPVHVGNCRRYVVSDLLRRLLEAKGLTVEQLISITDLSDRTLVGARRTGEEHRGFVDRHVKEFHQDMAALGVRPATHYLRSGKHQEEILALARKLVNKGFAYERMRSLYFDIHRFPDYGGLSGINLDKIRLGQTVDLENYDKSSPHDFTLLRRAELADIKEGLYWPSPWGNVRPAWALEYVALGRVAFGPQYDIHLSAADLLFPHHENMYAIGRAAGGTPPARYWVHNAPVTFKGHQISQSLGHVTTLRDLLDWGFSGREIRCWLLSTHYRKPLELSLRALRAARGSVARLARFMARLAEPGSNPAGTGLDQLVYQARAGFHQALEDDLNTSRALGHLFGLIKEVNKLLDRGLLDQAQRAEVADQVRAMDRFLEIIPEPEEGADQTIEKLVEKRDRARLEKDFAEADRIRDELSEMGVVIRDSPDGSVWRKG